MNMYYYYNYQYRGIIDLFKISENMFENYVREYVREDVREFELLEENLT